MKTKNFFAAMCGVFLLAGAAFATCTTTVVKFRRQISDLTIKNIEALLSPTEKDCTYCHNGGPGSTSCSIEAGIDLMGSGTSVGCSVSCKENYYSCCSLRCICCK